MGDYGWDCNVCDACGACGRSEAECAIYQDFYGFEEGRKVQQASSSAGVAVIEKKETRAAASVKFSIEANMGLVNRLNGRIASIVEGDEMALLSIKAGEKVISSMMPLQKFRESGKKEGDMVMLVFKASNVKIMK